MLPRKRPEGSQLTPAAAETAAGTGVGVEIGGEGSRKQVAGTGRSILQLAGQMAGTATCE